MQTNIKQKMKDYILKFNLKMEYFFFSSEIINDNFLESYNSFKEAFNLLLEELNIILLACGKLELILEFLKEERKCIDVSQGNTKGYLTLNFLTIQKKHLDLIIDLIENNKVLEKDAYRIIKNIFLSYFENVAINCINYKTKMLELKKYKSLDIKENKEIYYEFENDDDLSFNLTKYMIILSIFFEIVKEEKTVSLENYMKTKKELISNIIELYSILKYNHIENLKLMKENERKMKIIAEKNKDDLKNVLYTIISNYFSEIIKIVNENEKRLPEDMVDFLKKMLKISKF